MSATTTAMDDTKRAEAASVTPMTCVGTLATGEGDEDLLGDADVGDALEGVAVAEDLEVGTGAVGGVGDLEVGTGAV